MNREDLNREYYVPMIVSNIKNEIMQADSKLGWSTTFFGIILAIELQIFITILNSDSISDKLIYIVVFSMMFLFNFIGLLFVASGLFPRINPPRYKEKYNGEYLSIFHLDILNFDEKGYVEFIGSKSIADSLNIQSQIIDIKYNCVDSCWKMFFFPLYILCLPIRKIGIKK